MAPWAGLENWILYPQSASAAGGQPVFRFPHRQVRLTNHLADHRIQRIHPTQELFGSITPAFDLASDNKESSF
jgi:hypothetical protein